MSDQRLPSTLSSLFLQLRLHQAELNSDQRNGWIVIKSVDGDDGGV
jgi:hypothetical protein